MGTRREIKKPDKLRGSRRRHNQREIASILVVAEEAVVRRGLRSILEEQPGWKVAEASDSADAVLQATRFQPEIVIVEINMPDLHGAEAARSILNAMPDTRMLAFSASAAEGVIQAALDAGVLGFVLKSNAEKDLPCAVNALVQGRTFFAAPIFRRIQELWQPPSENPASSPLSERETKIVQLLAEGKSNREAAAVVGISVRTLESLRAKIMQKLNLKRFSDLVRYAVRNAIAEP